MNQSKPILLYNDECGVCRKIAQWVLKRALTKSGESTLLEQPIGEDPHALKLLSPDLNIWDAYSTIHLLMPDGKIKVGGEAVAEVLRSIPKTKWFAWTFKVSFLGLRPFQLILNFAYTMLSDIRPIFGCESCGTPGPVVKFLLQVILKLAGKNLATYCMRSTSL